GGGITAEFDTAMWAYCIEPFIMGPPPFDVNSSPSSELLELLLCAIGSPPDKRISLKVSQKNCCLDIRKKIFETWWRKLHHLPDNASLFGLPRPATQRVLRSMLMQYDILIWERIRAAVRQRTETFRYRIDRAVLQDAALTEFRSDPVPWQMTEILRQRADSWVTELYKICCDVQRTQGGEITAEFDTAMWAYCIEPFIMGPPPFDVNSSPSSELLELLLCAIGSPPDKRISLKVSQKNCCLDIRKKIFETWWRKLHHLPDNASLFGLPRPVPMPRTYTDGRIGVNSPGYPSPSLPRPFEETKEPAQMPQTTSAPLSAAPTSTPIL